MFLTLILFRSKLVRKNFMMSWRVIDECVWCVCVCVCTGDIPILPAHLMIASMVVRVLYASYCTLPRSIMHYTAQLQLPMCLLHMKV